METSAQLHLLTAPRGAGKTAFCRALAEQTRAAGWDVAGLLSSAVFENEVKTGILAENLRTGESRPLAELSTVHCSLFTDNYPLSTFHLPLGNWLFSSSSLAWGNHILETCLPCDLFIVDEIGPLELIRGEGWVNALDALRQSTYRIGLVVIRPEMMETARQALPIHEIISLDSLSTGAQEFFSTLEGA